MRILVSILKFPPDFTGAGLRIERLYKNLHSRGVDHVSVITTCSSAYSANIKMHDGMTIYYVARGHGRIEKQKNIISIFIKSLYVIKSAFKAVYVYVINFSRSDVIHTVDSSWLSTIVGLCAILTRKPLVKEITLLGSDDPLTLKKKLVFGSFFLLPFRYAKLIVVLSEPLKNTCLKIGIPGEKIWCRPNPIYISTEDEVSPNEREVNLIKKKILWVGKISPRKNVEFLIRSGFFLKGSVELIFVGPYQPKDPYFVMLAGLTKKLAEQTNMRISVCFPGPVDDIKKLAVYYKSSDIFWFASHNEGLPNAPIESLMYGTPVVSLPVNGIMEEVLRGDENGEIVSTEDPAEFADVVHRCLEKKFDRNAIAKRAKNRFDPGLIEEQTLEHFRRIVNNG